MKSGYFANERAFVFDAVTIRDVELSNFTCPRTIKWSKSTCPSKINLPENFFLFLEENICCGYSLEVPHQGASNEYPQHMFSLRNKKYLSYNLDTLLPELWITCPRTSKLKFLICPQGNGTSWTSRALVTTNGQSKHLMPPIVPLETR